MKMGSLLGTRSLPYRPRCRFLETSSQILGRRPPTPAPLNDEMTKRGTLRRTQVGQRPSNRIGPTNIWHQGKPRCKCGTCHRADCPGPSQSTEQPPQAAPGAPERSGSSGTAGTAPPGRPTAGRPAPAPWTGTLSRPTAPANGACSSAAPAATRACRQASVEANPVPIDETLAPPKNKNSLGQS